MRWLAQPRRGKRSGDPSTTPRPHSQEVTAAGAFTPGAATAWHPQPSGQPTSRFPWMPPKTAGRRRSSVCHAASRKNRWQPGTGNAFWKKCLGKRLPALLRLRMILTQRGKEETAQKMSVCLSVCPSVRPPRDRGKAQCRAVYRDPRRSP